jgi:hypothetical protein
MRRCTVAICAIRVAPMARSCSRARNAAHSHSCEAATAAWIVAMAATNAESATGVISAGAVRVKPGGGRRERGCAGERAPRRGPRPSMKGMSTPASVASRRSSEEGKPSSAACEAAPTACRPSRLTAAAVGVVPTGEARRRRR